jgi:hypothetical protein
VYEKTWSLIVVEEHRQIESVLEQGKVKLSHYRPEQTLRAPGVLRLPEFLNNRHIKMVRLSALSTDRLNAQEISITHLSEVGSTPGPQCGRRTKSIKNPSDPTGNRTR